MMWTDCSFELKFGGLGLSFTAIDQEMTHLPAYKFSVAGEIYHPTGLITYTADDIWMTAESLSRFLSDLEPLAKQRVGRAVLESMGNELVVSIESHLGSLRASAKIREYEPLNDDVTVNASLSSPDIDVVNVWLRSLQEFLATVRFSGA